MDPNIDSISIMIDISSIFQQDSVLHVSRELVVGADTSLIKIKRDEL